MAEWLVAPFGFEHFLSNVCERGALLVTRKHAHAVNQGCFDADDIWALLKARRLRYGEGVDVTLFTAARQRETFNHNGDTPPAPDAVRPSAAAHLGAVPYVARSGACRRRRADAGLFHAQGAEVANKRDVRRRYDGGCSVRVLHPQRHCEALARALALLEHAFQCAMGCNAYLTPPGSQVRPRLVRLLCAQRSL